MHDRSFMNGVGYVVVDSQWELFNKVIANIGLNYKSQTILAPNGSGKTAMSLLLALKLSIDGYTVLHYCDVPDGLEMQYVCQLMRCRKDLFSKIDFAGYNSIHKFANRFYEIVIIDSAFSCIDDFSLSNKESFRKVLFEAKRAKESGAYLSTGQLNIIAIDCLGTIIRRNACFVINLDRSDMPTIGYIPVLASNNVFTTEMSQEEFKAYSENINKELENISTMKKECALKGELTPEKGHDCDSLLADIYNELRQTRQEMKAGFGSIDEKLGNIHEDIQSLNQAMRDLECAVQDRKNLLEIFFSTESDDEKSTELFITKASTLITNEITSKIERLSNSQNYHVAEQLIRMKMGENAISKMSIESIKFLITAKYLFNQNMNLGEDIDYSSVCLLASKAFEVELSKRFINGYQDYLRAKGMSLEQWPAAMKKTMQVNYKTVTVPVTVEDFTLGNCPFIMGIRGRQMEREVNHNCFKDYCKNLLLKGLPDKEISNKCRDFDTYIKYVKDHYRNPAAHKTAIGLEEANKCLEYIVEVERVLRIMVETFKI